MKYGEFVNEGKAYRINTLDTPSEWYNYHFNNSYMMTVDQMGQGQSNVLSPVERRVDRGYRYFYLQDSENNECYNLTGIPLVESVESYQCIHSVEDTKIIIEKKQIETCTRVFVPQEDSCEIWTCTMTNHSEQDRKLNLYSVFAMENSGMGAKANFDTGINGVISHLYPYHIRYDDQKACEELNNYSFLFSTQKPTSWECSEQRFFGNQNHNKIPAVIKNGSCSNMISEFHNPVGGFQHEIIIPAGKSITLSNVFGCANNEDIIHNYYDKYGQQEKIEQAYVNLSIWWKQYLDPYKIDTPDKDLNIFMNVWLKKQAVAMVIGHRYSVLSCVRNELQDAMGYSFLDPVAAVDKLKETLSLQESNGYLKQWHIINEVQPDRGLALLHHMDACAWIAITVPMIVHQVGRKDILEDIILYKDHTSGSLCEHVMKAIRYLYTHRGEHGLCLFGDGDWNDPMNGIGRLGKGESAWTTMALHYGIQEFAMLLKSREDRELLSELEHMQDTLKKVINEQCFIHDRFIIGYGDNGQPIGTSADAEGHTYLNAQTWAIIAACVNDHKYGKAMEAIDRLETPCGPVVISPAYLNWNPKVGKVSVKRAGTTENGSVYCHAVLFKAYADCIRGDGTSALKTIQQVLPTNPLNPPEKNLQIPIFVPNFYFGLQDSVNFGQSSRVHSTGTAAWIIKIVLEHLLGLKAKEEGLTLSPLLPDTWDEAYVERNYKKAVYKVNIIRAMEKGTWVNGIVWREEFLPYEENMTYEVTIQI